jgi:protein-S-isoprenylcysteine O-methyltransferase Ste14
MAARFGKEYEKYATVTPRYIPKLGATVTAS